MVHQNFGKGNAPKEVVYNIWRNLFICIPIHLSSARLPNASLKYSMLLGVNMAFLNNNNNNLKKKIHNIVQNVIL